MNTGYHPVPINNYPPQVYYYPPVPQPQGPAYSPAGLQRILIAILILVALDLVVVRPHKYAAERP